MGKWFKGINTLEELKREFKRLALQYHPDRPTGNTRIMQELNAEYEIMFNLLKNRHETNTNTKTNETAADFMEIINKIINLNIDIEICGSWIWVSGNTYGYKNELKNAGFLWAGKKKMWYWRSEEDKHTGKSKMSIEEIRAKYGSERINTASRMAAIA